MLKNGFNYPYLLCFPTSDMQKVLVMDCLNNYENAMPNDRTENVAAVDNIYKLFGNDRVSSTSKPSLEGKTQETLADSTLRVAKRLQSASNHIAMIYNNAGFFDAKAPIMMPLVPGYANEDIENNACELNRGVAKEVSVQIAAMIRDAQNIIQERTGKKLEDRILAYGHSKSTTFADNFSTLHPELVKAMVLGGGTHTALPIEEIRLRVSETTQDKEQFEVINGIPYRNITGLEFNEIVEEYTKTKEPHQREIMQNRDGTYSLPINYPLGIADIEQYVDLSAFPGGKEEYKKCLAQIPRMLFVGEREEEHEGHFAYNTGKTLSGKQYKFGDDLDIIEPGKSASELYETEKASMHNRVLDYISATRILFGRSTNECLENFNDLTAKLGLEAQSKVYEGVSHFGIYRSADVKKDTKKLYEGISSNGKMAILGDNGRAARISPIFQLLRRLKVAKSQSEYDKKSEGLPKLPEFPDEGEYASEAEYSLAKQQYEIDLKEYYTELEQMLVAVDAYLKENRNIDSKTNINKLYDELTSEELQTICLRDKVVNRDLLASAIEATEEQGIRTPEINEESRKIHDVYRVRDEAEKTEDTAIEI